MQRGTDTPPYSALHTPSWQSQDHLLDRSDLDSPSSSPQSARIPQQLPGHLNQNHHLRRIHHIPKTSIPQCQLERLVAEAESVVGDISATNSPCEGDPSPNDPPISNRDRQDQPPKMFPSTGPVPPRQIPRNPSIDSAISSTSVQSAVSQSPTNATSQPTGSLPPDIHSLIQAAGSSEELIRFMLKEKQSVTAQNAQLWRLVDKQRAMILGLNKDLERAMKEKDRYRKKLKEQMGIIPTLPSSVGTDGARTSPVPSLDGQSRSGTPSPPRSNGMHRSESLTSSADERGRGDYHEVSHAPYPASSSGNQPQRNQRMPSPTEHAPTQNGTPTADLDKQPEFRSSSPRIVFRDPREVTSPDIFDQERRRIESPAPLSPTTSPTQRPIVPQLHINSETYNHTKLVTSPTSGLGKSPFRKAPPKPLDLPHSQLQHQVEITGNEDESEYGAAGGTGESGESWTATPLDKKALLVPKPKFNTHGPLTAPPTRALPAPYLPQPPMTPNPSSLDMARRFPTDGEVSRIRPQFVRAPLLSTGLPSSPRPADRPPNSPLPRASRNFSVDSGLTGSSRPAFQSMSIPPFNPGTPRISMPLASPRLPQYAGGHERAGSEGSTLAPKMSLADLVIQPSEISHLELRVVSSRMKPSRASMIPGKAKTIEDSVFTLGVFSKSDGKEILRVEKDVGSLPALDSKLKRYISYTVKIPERALFTGYAPARVDARRVALDEYFTGVMNAAMEERAALALCEFFSTDIVETYPNSFTTFSSIKELTTGDPASVVGTTVVKEGYLTKRGKNFGGWKERYFVLDGAVLKYFDAPGGAQLGQIKLQNAQIGRQSASQKTKDDGTVDEDSQYRHAFLVLEPKRKDSSNLVRHVLCAENDKERDEWVAALLEFVTVDKEKDKEEESKIMLKTSKSKEGKDIKESSEEIKGEDDSSLRSMSYEEVIPGPLPARGPSPEELNRQVSPSPTSMVSLPAASPQQFSPNSPVPDRGYPAKQISAPSGGAVILDLAAWGASKKAMTHEEKKAEKAAKKRSIWGFRQPRGSSDFDDGKGSNVQNPHQQVAERFPLSRSVFGASLEEAVYLTKPPGTDVALPAVVYRCIEFLDAKNASQEEGIFRLSGSNVVIKGLKERFNTGTSPSSNHHLC